MPPGVDVLVVGGGPAGASTAFQLARRGVRVQVLDRAHFPRSKPCAECLSPQASRLLRDMGVLEELQAQGAALRGMIVRAPNGMSARGDYAAEHGFQPFRDRGLSVRRELLDDVLLRRARQADAVVLEGARVMDVCRDNRGFICGVRVLSPKGETELRARVVVGADGLRSVIARRTGLAHVASWPRRISLVAHYRGVRDISDYCEMHVEGDGFVGIADVGHGVTTVAAVFAGTRAKQMSGDRAAFLDAWLASKPHLGPRFAAATHIASTVAVGPFASHTRRAWRPGAVLVGDAADFFDPFTGEGIYSALRGGELVAGAVALALERGALSNQIDAFREYDRLRRGEFHGKWWVERLIAVGVSCPSIANRAVRALAARKDLADLLVGVTGDFVPAGRVLRASYLAQLFLLPTRRVPTAPA